MKRASKKRPYAAWPEYKIEQNLLTYQTIVNELRKELRMRQKAKRELLFICFGHGTEFTNR